MVSLAQQQNNIRSDITNTQREPDLEVSLSCETTTCVIENLGQGTRLENNDVGTAIQNLLEECRLTQDVLNGDLLFDKAADISFNAMDNSFLDNGK